MLRAARSDRSAPIVCVRNFAAAPECVCEHVIAVNLGTANFSQRCAECGREHFAKLFKRFLLVRLSGCTCSAAADDGADKVVPTSAQSGGEHWNRFSTFPSNRSTHLPTLINWRDSNLISARQIRRSPPLRGADRAIK